MRIKRVKIEDLTVDDDLVVSRPLKPELHEKFEKLFPGLPAVKTDEQLSILSGIDSYYYLKDKGVNSINVLILNMGKPESLFLGYTERGCLQPHNLYEKLFFIRNVLKYTDVRKIYFRTGIDIKIDKKLTENIEILLTNEFRDLLIKDLITFRTAIKLIEFNGEDRNKFLGLFGEINFSSSRQRNLIELVEEICFRDKTEVDVVFKSCGVQEIIDRKGSGDDVFSAISKLRYPEYYKREAEWAKEVKSIKFPFKYSLHHSPFFEKERLELRLFPDSLEEVKALSEKIGK